MLFRGRCPREYQAFRGVQHFITASTVCTYGKRFARMPIRECDTFTPWTDYGINKHEADLVYQQAWKDEGFPVTMMKPCTSYSEMSGALRSFATEHTWIDRVKRGKPILICGDGDILHQYMHTRDTARSFVACWESRTASAGIQRGADRGIPPGRNTTARP